ncbi:DNA primase [Fontibacillus phaseoli]|uniref:DNA primase n=1 Tax=Fontibacillus phaseoli TaxID=1416533 RepID=A0A369BR10_9BACL|nr:toprim domain-containing protein [Fontibacillus phaseoli]RCX22897.1 DNA primase [Fontibacillus phaseoli]
MLTALMAEIERYPWRNPRWHADKLEASSPNREDDRPSFRVTTDPDSELFGCWNDSGAIDPHLRRGGPVQLLAMLRGIDEETARQILTESERDGPADYITLQIRKPTAKARARPLDIALLDRYSTDRSDYLTNRGISPEVQALFRTGYDPQSRAVTIPWFDAAGRLLTVKYRTTYAKRFWYTKGGVPVRDLIYGIDVIHSRNIKLAACVESEIDALYLWTIGVPAIATGGAAFNEKKRNLILRSPIETLVLLRDNDAAGRAWRNEIAESLQGRLRLEIALVPSGYKDPTEAGITEIGKTREIYSPLVNFMMTA